MPRLTAAQAEHIWGDLIDEYVCHILGYLKQIKFDKDGKMRADSAGALTHHIHWDLVEEWEKRIGEMEK